MASRLRRLDPGILLRAATPTRRIARGRGARFLLVAALLRYFGTPVRASIEERLTLVTTGFAAMVVLGFVALRYL